MLFFKVSRGQGLKGVSEKHKDIIAVNLVFLGLERFIIDDKQGQCITDLLLPSNPRPLEFLIT